MGIIKQKKANQANNHADNGLYPLNQKEKKMYALALKHIGVKGRAKYTPGNAHVHIDKTGFSPRPENSPI